jgi:hypothetical protein
MIIILSIILTGTYFIAFKSYKYALFMFIATYPLNYIFQSQYMIIPIPFHSGFGLFLIAHHMFLRKIDYSAMTLDNYKLLSNLKVILLIIFTLVIYRKFKQVLYFDISQFKLIITVINKSIMTLAVYFTAKMLYVKGDEFKTVQNALVLSAMVIIISMYYSEVLYTLGFAMRESNDIISSSSRLSGFYYAGDVNSVGVFLNFILALRLFSRRDDSSNIIRMMTIFILAYGVALTGSRMAFITMGITMLLYLISMKNLSGKKLYAITASSISFLMVYYLVFYTPIFETTFDRLLTKGVLYELNPNAGSGTRLLRWISFIKYSFSSVYRFVLGNDSVLYTNVAYYFRDPHGHFIHILYYNGIVMLMFYVYYIAKYQISIMKRSGIVFGLSLFLPFLIGSVLISNINEFSLYLMIAPAFVNNLNYRKNY